MATGNPSPVVDGERRPVTVLFADLVGFTAFAERAGEEAAYRLAQRIASLLRDAVEAQGGILNSFMGDGAMALFGVPHALEDAPLRACRAALLIQDQLARQATEIEIGHGLRPQMRVGLNTGLAVVARVEVGEGASGTALGDTTNLASRLQALAEPGTVLLSEATHRLVQGMVETTFCGEHRIKGKSEPQRVYRLDSIRYGAARFEAAVSRGLGTFVGRERELETLEQGLAQARSQICVIDLVAEPGMGKSRLLHEFRRRIGKDRAFFLAGNCAPDGQQTSFLPLIEVVRGSFRIVAGDSEKEVAQKLEMGLAALGSESARNLGLLLHLLGLSVPDGALRGLDGVLIGLRTRELLQQLLEARCRLSPVVMVIEDAHWIDSASAEVLQKIVESEAALRLLLIQTRRPEYKPSWLDRTSVTALHLQPLPAGDVRRLLQTRAGIDAVPEALVRHVVDKAEGNPLFAEEIVSFLAERGVLRIAAGKLDFDASAVAAALPASVQNLLTARVDSLSAKDRGLLQAASVIGRRFDPQLLAVAVGGTGGIEARLAAMETLDLIRPERNSTDYAFKHALVQDALYQSLLTEARTALHLKVAEEIERRSGNRLIEVAEVLAHHYSHPASADKAFTYLSMAGSKSVGVYSLDEAATHFTAALGLLDQNPDCASDGQVAEFLVSYTLLLNMTAKFNATIAVLQRFLPRIDRLGDQPRAVLIRHNYVFVLLWNTRYREAAAIQRGTSEMAERLGDSRSKAYALTGELLVSTIAAPKPLEEFEALKKEVLQAASDTSDAYIQNWARFVVAWEEFHLGRMNQARDAARDLMEVGRLLEDPRSTGLGLCVLALIALLSDSYAEALEYSEQSIAVAVTPFDRETAINIKGCVLALLRRTEEALPLLEAFRRRAFADGDLYSLTTSDSVIAVSNVLQGKIGTGIGLLEEAMARREREGYRAAADWYRLFLAEVYLQIIERKEKLPLGVLLRNLPILLKVMATGSSRIRARMTEVLGNPRLHRAGHFVGRAQMILGLLYKNRKKPAAALEHLTEARRIFAQFGKTPMLTRVDAALAELGQ